MRDGEDVETIELQVAESAVGRLRMRSRDGSPIRRSCACSRTVIASEVERVRAPARASEEAAATFLRDLLAGRIADRDDLVARGKELGIDLSSGAAVLVARAHPRNPIEDDWRRRLLALAGRGARAWRRARSRCSTRRRVR